MLRTRRWIRSIALAGPIVLGTLLASPAATAAAAWRPIGPRHDATVSCLVIAPSNPRVVYAGLADGGVQRSDDGGVSWHPASFGLGDPAVNGLAVDPTDPDKVYAATEGGFG